MDTSLDETAPGVLSPDAAAAEDEAKAYLESVKLGVNTQREPGAMLGVAKPVDAINSAAVQGDVDAVAGLIAAEREAGVDIFALSYLDDSGIGPLTSAAIGGSAAIVTLLLDHGGREHLHRKAEHGEEPLASAAERGYLDIVKIFLACGLQDTGVLQEPALVLAAEGGHLDVVAHLLEVKASAVDQVKDASHKNTYAAGNAKSRTALVAASEKGHLAIVRLLVEKGASIEYRTSNGDSALSRAVRGRHTEVTDFLREKGATDAPMGKKKLNMNRFGGLNLDLSKGPSAHVQGNITLPPAAHQD